MEGLAGAATHGWPLIATVFLLGARHGFDLDHIAAISAISASPEARGRSFLLATLYALGHGAVVLLLGLVAVLAGRSLPSSVDLLMGRVVGATLVLLGTYVLYNLVRAGPQSPLQSRWMLAASALRRLRPHVPQRPVEIEHEHAHVHGGTHAHDHTEMNATDAASAARLATAVQHRHRHRHAGVMPPDPFTQYGLITAVGIGMLHGVGAETPTQLLLFLTAAGVRGAGLGILLLFVFVAGLLASNTALAAVVRFGSLHRERWPFLYRGVAVATAIFSLLLGLSLLLSDAA